MYPLAEERGQTPWLNAQEISAFADAAMLQPALLNLANNARTHAGRGVTIIVEVAQDAQGPILSVRDDGPGITERDRDKVLEPFVRLDQARTTPGSGLGLALAKAVADHHGATLELNAAKPGLRVELRLPNIKKV